jgi:hypothetical protein
MGAPVYARVGTFAGANRHIRVFTRREPSRSGRAAVAV